MASRAVALLADLLDQRGDSRQFLDLPAQVVGVEDRELQD